MKKEQLHELLYQALETETGGVQVYETAIRCAVNHDLKKEWQKYLKQTREHEEIMRELVETMGLDPAAETPGRQVVRHKSNTYLNRSRRCHKNIRIDSRGTSGVEGSRSAEARPELPLARPTRRCHIGA